MSKFYTLSPDGVPENPVLFPNIRPYWEQAGHVFVDSIEDADIFCIDLHTRIADYKQSDIDFILSTDKPCATWDEFDKGGLSDLDWPDPLTDQQKQIFKHIEDKGIKAVHFCRLLNKTKTYPANVFPYEKSLSYEEPLLTPEQLFERECDVVYISNDAPSRSKIKTELLLDHRLKCLISIGEPKIPFERFIELHKKGKFFISSAAGGFTDERVQCLFSVAGIIRQRTDQLLLHDFTHGENCLRIDSPPTQKDLDEIYEICNDNVMLYEIYRSGYEYVKKYYSAEYIASNILETIKKEGLI